MGSGEEGVVGFPQFIVALSTATRGSMEERISCELCVAGSHYLASSEDVSPVLAKWQTFQTVVSVSCSVVQVV